MEQEEKKKEGFFKYAWNSITKPEKYAEMASKGLPKSIKFLIALIFIFSLIMSFGQLYKVNQEIKEVKQYIESEIPDFTYNEGILQLDSEEPITKEMNLIGKLIIDTNQEDENKINEYIDVISKEKSGIVLLKDKVLVKTETLDASINYTYSDLLSGINVTEFTKQSLIEYINSSSMNTTYFQIFAVLVVYTFVIYLINTLVNVLGISIFGYIASLIIKMKMKYRAIFNMSVYSITLSTILSMIYILIKTFTGFTIEFFDVMYITVACIYLIAAILMIKSDFIKKQKEVIKVVTVEKTAEKEEKSKPEEEQTKDKPEEKTKKKKEQKENENDEPEGSNA